LTSPGSQGLFHRAVGESGAFFSPQPLPLGSLEASEEAGAKFAPTVGADSLAALRAKPGADLIKGTSRERWFTPSLDGWVLPRDAYTVFAAGQQSHVPLLAGWNADETRAGVLLGGERPTASGFTEQTRKRFGADADALLKVYPATSDAEAVESAASLGSDLFIGYGTWKWVEMHAKTGNAPVFCYSFDRKVPVPPDHKVNGKPATSADVGARHAGEIEYVFGALDSVPKVTWEPVDRRLSDLIMSYWSNFARSGDPNGPGLPKWPRYDESAHAVMHLDGAASQAAADTRRPRYEALDAITEKTRSK
jgi:para-nitrobenzyl esterase